ADRRAHRAARLASDMMMLPNEHREVDHRRQRCLRGAQLPAATSAGYVGASGVFLAEAAGVMCCERGNSDGASRGPFGSARRTKHRPISEIPGNGEASDGIACSAAHPEPNEKDRPQAKAMQVTNGGMVIVETSSSRVSRSGPRRIVMRIVFGL